MAKDTSLTFSLYGKDVSATSSMKKVGKESESLGKQFTKMGKVAAAGLAVAGVAAAKFAYDAGQAASDMAETQSKVKVIFGKSAGSIEKFAESAAKSLGQSKQSAMDAAANFAIFGKAAGMQGKGLVDFSTNLTTTAADMASFANTTPQEAIDALGAALRGEMEPIRRYGVLLDQETLKNRGTIMGFGKEIGNSLTGGQKVMFATAEIMEQLGKRGSNTLGDFSRTSDGLANRQRIMAAEFDNTKVKIGEQLLPVMQKFAGYVLETVVPNVQGFIDGLTGVKNKGGEAAASAHDFGEKVKGVVKWISDHEHVVKGFASLVAGIFVGIKTASIISALGSVGTAFLTLTGIAATTAGAEAAATGGASLAIAAPAIAAIAATFGAAALLGIVGVDAGNVAPIEEETAATINARARARTRAASAAGRASLASGETFISNGITYTWDAKKKEYWSLAMGNTGSYRDYSNPHPDGAPLDGRAVGGSVMGRTSYLVGERGPELFTPSTSGRITPNGLGGGSGVNVVVNVQGSVIREKDLAVTIRDNIGVLMRRQGLNPSILGV